MKPSTITLSVLLAAALAYAGHLQSELNRLKDGEAPADGSTAAAAVESPTQEGPTVEGVEARPTVSSDVAAEGAPVAEPPAATEARESWETRRAERMRQMLAAFDDPEMRVDMIERQMNRVDARYADFFKTLDLRPEDLDTLRALMAERGVVGWETRMRTFGADSEEARADAEQARELQQELLKEQIAQVLGEENADRLQDYTDSLPYRGEVEALASSLSFTDSPLSPAQSEALVGAIREVSESFEYTVDLSGRRGREASAVDASAIETFFQERAARDERVLQAAAESLDDAQLAAYAERQLAERERDRRQMEFAQQNPGGFGRGGPRGGGPRP